jgi:hypothetical protein
MLAATVWELDAPGLPRGASRSPLHKLTPSNPPFPSGGFAAAGERGREAWGSIRVDFSERDLAAGGNDLNNFPFSVQNQPAGDLVA